jgi:hypothetical protein
MLPIIPLPPVDPCESPFITAIFTGFRVDGPAWSATSSTVVVAVDDFACMIPAKGVDS